MASFPSFSNRLPDPNYAIEETGKGGSGTVGPGFATIKVTANQPTSVSITNSGRVTARSIAGHRWKIVISYNPLTRAQFEPIHNFLLERRGRLKTFEVVLPQYNSPRTTTSGTINVDNDIVAGATNFSVDGFGSVTGGLRPGDMFNFTDTNNSNHKKIYRIVRVLTYTDFLAGNQPADANHRIYYTSPSVEKAVQASTTTLTYSNPVFRVIQEQDTREYSLGTNNLYKFSLNLVEAQP
jgi:hypothetical protein